MHTALHNTIFIQYKQHYFVLSVLFHTFEKDSFVFEEYQFKDRLNGDISIA